MLLKAVKRLVPRDGTIELYGKLAGTAYLRLTKEARLWIDEKLERDSERTGELSERLQEGGRGLVIDEPARQKLLQGIPVTVEGALRRVDLDVLTPNPRPE